MKMLPRMPLLEKAVRFGLIGLGSTLVLSAVANITAAWQLIEAAEEQALGVTRNEIVGWYSMLFAIGTTMILVGLRWRK
jgi:hypothetical protein